MSTELWGIGAIARHLNVSPNTIKNWHRRQGFLMFKRRERRGARTVWYSDPELILSWKIARCRVDRAAEIARIDRAGQSGPQAHTGGA
jgi:uncharacterized protein YjcR